MVTKTIKIQVKCNKTDRNALSQKLACQQSKCSEEFTQLNAGASLAFKRRQVSSLAAQVIALGKASSGDMAELLGYIDQYWLIGGAEIWLSRK